MSIRAGIIGCGMIAGRFEDFSAPGTYSHAKAYRGNRAYGELAFVDCDADRAGFLASKAGGKAYGTIEGMLVAFRPDVVSVCVPDDLHYRVLETLLRSAHLPQVIFAEKPVCTTRSELLELLRLQQLGTATVIVNHSRRFDAAHRRLGALLRCGGLGRPVSIRVDYYGGWRHLGVHVVDTLQYFFGEELQLNRLEYVCESKYPGDPTLDVDGRIRGARVRLDGYPEEYYQILDMNIMCEGGQAKLSDFGKRIEVLRKTVNAEQERVLETDPSCGGEGMQSPICRAVELLAGYLADGDGAQLVPYGLEQARRTMETIWTGEEMYANRS